MQKFFQVIGILVLMVGSFIYTDKIEMTSKNSDTLLNEIKSKKSGYKENAIEPFIDDDVITPGVNGREVDVSRSYQEMSKVGYFDDKLLVYKTLFVENSLDKNKDKYIVSLNNSKMHVALVFKVSKNDDITDIINELDKRKLKASFFVDSGYLEKHHNQIINLVEKGYTVGNLSNNEDYEDSDFVWMKTIITNIGSQKYNYCYTTKPSKVIINNCKIQDSYTIMPGHSISKKYFINIKKFLQPGAIISVVVSDDLKRELELILNYISSKGYIIKSLEDGLKE